MQPSDLLLRQNSEALRDLDAAVPLPRRDWLEAPSGRVASLLTTDGMNGAGRGSAAGTRVRDGIGLTQGDWDAPAAQQPCSGGGESGHRRGIHSIRSRLTVAFSGLRGGRCWWARFCQRSTPVVLLVQLVMQS